MCWWHALIVSVGLLGFDCQLCPESASERSPDPDRRLKQLIVDSDLSGPPEEWDVLQKRMEKIPQDYDRIHGGIE